MGGLPDAFGRGNFSTGGTQDEDVTTTATNAELFLRAAPSSTSALSYALSLGAGYRGNSLHTVTTLADKAAGPAGTASQGWDGDGHTTFLLGAVDASLADYATATLSARTEPPSLFQGSSSPQLYPAAHVSWTRA